MYGLVVHRLVNNQREVLEFAFSDVFDTEVQQEQVTCCTIVQLQYLLHLSIAAVEACACVNRV